MSLALGGCIRAEPVPYGITEDTGGHITYLLGEMEALAARDDVTRAEIVTRRFDEPMLGSAYAKPEEWLSPKLVIRRIDSGNPHYLAKEALGADRGAFVRALLAELRARPRLPDIIHAHFADAADVAAAVERELGVPFIYTAHSLALDKRSAMRVPSRTLEARIGEENRAIAKASAIIGSSRDECERQLAAYPATRAERIHRLPPGIAQRQADGSSLAAARELIAPFLRVPGRPIALAIARPVHKKNLAGLVEAFGSDPELRDRANLVILAGQRTGLLQGEEEQVSVLRAVVDAIDRHDLHGKVAYPRSHGRKEVEGLYALAAQCGGVFVNPALVEPYGLTIVEAAVHGLPVVATMTGGPGDIVGELGHGLLVDPTDPQDIAKKIRALLDDRELWSRCAASGQELVRAMTWDRYAEGFINVARAVLAPERVVSARPASLIVSDIDGTLTGCAEGAARFRQFVERRRDFAFVTATGRSLPEARRVLREWGLPQPAAWITSVGTEIYYGGRHGLVPDSEFAKLVEAGWDGDGVTRALADVDGLVPQAAYEQRRFKRSYHVADAGIVPSVTKRLAENGLAAQVVFSHETLLDVIPAAAGKGAALEHVARHFGVAPEQVFAAGDSGNDACMLSRCRNAILVGNYAEELRELASRDHVYVARRYHGAGALEGILAHRIRHRARQRAELRSAA
jgi:sucrose-phosphate synthase